MAKKSGLGRGMNAIFVDNSAGAEATAGGTTMLRLSKIEPNPAQPRHEFDSESLSELADSIANNGLIQPVVVRPTPKEGFYSIIAGERRWRASKMAGLSEIPVIIMEVDDKKASELALIENVQRKDLNPVEEALGYRALIDDYSITQADLAGKVGKSRVTITNSLRLLELPEPVLQLLAKGELSTGHARALLGLKNTELIAELAEETAENGYSVRVVEDKVRKLNSARPDLEKPVDPDKLQRTEYFKAIESIATERIGSKVKIRSEAKNKTVTIAFDNNDELEDILKRLCGDDIFEKIN